MLNDILISELGNLVHYLGNSSDFMYATQCIYLGNYTNLKKKFKQRLFTEVFSLGDVLLLILTALATLSLICVPFLLLVLKSVFISWLMYFSFLPASFFSRSTL